MLAFCWTALLFADDPADAIAKIIADHQAAVRALDAERRSAKTTPAKITNLTNRAKPDGFADRLLKAAKQAPESPAAFDALSWILSHDGGAGLAKAQTEAAELVLGHHLADPKVPKLCSDLSSSRSAAAETLLRGVLEKGPSREARGKACFALAAYLQCTATWADYCQFSDGQQRKMMDLTPEGRALRQRMSGLDTRGLRDEAKELSARAAKDFADQKPPPAKGPTTPGVSGPPIGKRAPEIVGEDLDGKSMKLSDYRGKVVVIEFWAWLCVYCRALVPPDQELISRMRGQPFALIGVNGDFDLAAMEKSAKDANLPWPTWRSWRNGQAIAAKWGINRWPTTIVLDHHGVVRHVGLTGRDLQDAVEALIKEALDAK